MSDIQPLPLKPKHKKWSGMLDISFDDYKKAPGLNFHGLKEFYRSPAHYRVYRDESIVEKKETPAMRMGRLLHKATLEPELFLQTCVEGPEVSSKNTKIWRDFVASHPGKDVLDAKDRNKLIGMSNAILGNKWASRMLHRGKGERSLFVRDPETGVLLKARTDFLSAVINGIVDLKKCQDARFFQFRKSVRNYMYHCQAAFYLKVANLLNLEKEAFVLIAVEEEPPHGVVTYQLGRDTLITGENWVDAGIRSFAKAVHDKNWGCYLNPEVEVMDLEPWDLSPELVQ